LQASPRSQYLSLSPKSIRVFNVDIMPQKRKQPEIEIFNSTPSPPKRNKPSLAAPKRKALEDISDSPTLPSPKRARYNAQPTAAPDPSRTRPSTLKAETSPSQNTSSTKSRLVPRGARKSAKTGHKDETLLRMLCDDTETGELKELHFRNMPYSSIDWNSVHHINKINNWRNQIYGRAGMKSKAVTVWLPDEELWFELYFQLSIAESRARGFLLPKTLHVLTAFNKTFVGQVVQDHHGLDTAPRVERAPNAFASKFNRMCPDLRARLFQCTFGKSGDMFVPEITLEMLNSYKAMKTEMGLDKETVYAVDLEKWCRLFANLPSIGGDDGVAKEESVSSAEDEAAAVLVSMATAPYGGVRCATPVREVDIWSLIASPD
jgi:hypothetical protein